MQNSSHDQAVINSPKVRPKAVIRPPEINRQQETFQETTRHVELPVK